MRLLERKRNDEFSLTKDFDGNVPTYAILSHTWGNDDQEVTFKDINEGLGKSKAGYQKIRFCGEQAARDGYLYSWVDTCCIDKTNSVELSEALNSMYRWYQNAAQCYVYLADVSIYNSSSSNGLFQSGYEDFRKSKWFTRGWTLQELVAPKSIKFFSVEGEFLGDKKSLEQQIHEATGIPVSALQGTPLSEFDVEERFSWAENRETKKEEDRAYSLLGIFDVSLPLIYGEGRDHAFRRLREAVEQSVNFITSRRHECIRSLSFGDITSRRNDISQAHPNTCEWLFKTSLFKKWKRRTDLQSNNGILWIKGHPGVGKSTLMKHALQYCQENFKDHNIAFYFFNARGRSLEKSPLGMLRSLVVQLLEQDPFLSDAFIPTFLIKKTRHRASEWRWKTGELKEFLLMEYQRHHDKPTLLIIDALDECSDSDVQEVVDFLEDLSEYAIQSSSNLRICLSSRHYPTIDMKKKIELVVEQQAKHDRDISRYVQSKLITTNKYIQKRILEKSQHIFIWVVLVVHLLNMEFNRGQIKAMWTRLDEIPDDMDELFLEILERKDSEDGKKMTLLLFQWVLFAVQPLKPTQLYFAVLAGTDPPELGAWDRSQVELETIDRFITSCSKGLVEIRPKVNYYTGEDESGVQFIHQSVIDCLTRNHRISRLDLALGSTAAGTSHSRLASCCMAYIMQQDLESLTIDMSLGVDATKVKESYPLLEYASMNLLTHAENAQADGITQVSLLQQLEDHRGYEILRKLHDIWTPDVYKFKETRLLYALSLYGCDSLVRALLHDRGADVNAQGGFYDTALQAAAAFGSTTIVTLLLDCGADVNAQGGHYNTALQAAAAVGSTAIVTLLLDRGADINADGGYYNTALQAAAAVYDSIDLVTLLLDRGADVNAQGGYYGNALQAAATEYDSMATITLLLDRGADVNAQGGYYGNALQAAAVLDNLVTVTLLLDRGADVNAHGGLYETALQAATERCKGDLRMLLLEWGALEP